MRNNLLYTVLFLFILTPAISQTDNDFWFVVPQITPDHNGPNQPSHLVITTKNLPVSIEISMPANPTYPVDTINVPANSVHKHILSNTNAEYDILESNIGENWEGLQGKTNRGLNVRSLNNTLFTVYFEYNNANNPDIFPLKGSNALGQEFYLSFQNFLFNMSQSAWDEPAYSAADIVATEDGTVVDVYTDKDIAGYAGLNHFQITLDAGETFTLVPALDLGNTAPNFDPVDDAYGRLGSQHLSGVRVVSDKDVVISLKDDSMKAAHGGCYDLAGDQIIPTSVIGREYIAMRGQLSSGNPHNLYVNAGLIPAGSTVHQERLYIVGTQDNDSVFVNGQFFQEVDEGETVEYVIPPDSLFTHVRTINPSYVWQISGWNCEMGGAILPPTDKCTGSTEVGFTVSQNSSSDYRVYLNVMVRKGAEGSFEFTSDGNDLTQVFDTATWVPVEGDDDWMVYRTEDLVDYLEQEKQSFLKNNKDVFHLGIIYGTPTGGTRFGYFSNYNEFKLNAIIGNSGSQNHFLCKGESAQLIVQGGTNIEWEPSLYLDDPESLTPVAAPPSNIVYSAIASGMCNISDTQFVNVNVSYPINANLTTTDVVGCSPLSVDVKSKASGVRTRKYLFEDGSGYMDSIANIYPDTLTVNDTYNYMLDNFGDTVRHLKATFIVANGDFCYDTAERYVTIYPQVNSDFTTSDTIGCNPLSVSFTNNSSGDAERFEWDFGDGSGDYTADVNHLFRNIGDDDTTYTVMLETESSYYCTDTTLQDVVVHPYIDVKFTIDTAYGCAPFNAYISNLCIGVDTFNFIFEDLTTGTIDSSFTSTTFNDFVHVYTNPDSIPHDKRITLIGKNEQGCYDTISRELVVYPQANASFFTIDNPVIGCDSLNVKFFNTSTGYNISYLWDFGDNSSSTEFAPSHLFLNKTSSVIFDTVTLTVENKYHCRYRASQVVTLYPYVDALFSVDTVIGCNPLSLNIENKSVGATQSLIWDMGDGTIFDSTFTSYRHIYNNTSTTNDSVYQLRVIASNFEGCYDTMTTDITVYHDLDADFTRNISSGFGLCDEDSLVLTNASIGESSLVWDFGDGAISTNPDTVVHYYQPNYTGQFIKLPISLTAYSQNEVCKSVKTDTVRLNPDVNVLFTASDYYGCHPLTDTLLNETKGVVDNWRWSIDGAIIDGNSINSGFYDTITDEFIFTFNNALPSSTERHAIVKLRVGSGYCVPEYFTDTIHIQPEIVADFNMIDSMGCHPYTPSFENLSFNATDFRYISEDGAILTAFEPVHRFDNFSDKDTVYDVKLIASTDFCRDSVTKSLTVYNVPKPIFTMDQNKGCNPLDVSIYNQAKGANRYEWNYGDGSLVVDDSTKDVKYHTYYNWGSTSMTKDTTKIFPLSLTAYNDNCSNTDTQYVKVYPEIYASFIVDTAGCAPHRVNFFNASKNAEDYRWDYADGMVSAKPEPLHTFENKTGADITYPVKLTASTNDCYDDTVINVTAYAQPNATFSVDNDDANYPDTVRTFLNLTNPEDGPWAYEWYMGDGNSYNGYPDSLVHRYVGWDTFSVELKAFSDKCRDSVTNNVIIRPPLPIPCFTMPPDSCVPRPAQFTNCSRYGTEYLWNFDEFGATSRVEEPFYIFRESGEHVITLTVKGPGGVSTINKTLDIYPDPVVEFTYTPELVMLPDACINVTNTNPQPQHKYLWEFGDGGTSDDPVRTDYCYTLASADTVYDIKLTAKSQYGCIASDSTENFISILSSGDIKFPNVIIPKTSGPPGGNTQNLNVYDDYIFRPKYEGVVEYKLQVFNRWGELIFESYDVDVGWDGYHNGKLCSQGVYVWKVTGTYTDGNTFIKTGDVTLLLGDNP